MDLVAPSGPVYQAGTLSANPVAMTAGLAMLKKLMRDNPYAELERKTRELARALESAAARGGARRSRSSVSPRCSGGSSGRGREPATVRSHAAQIPADAERTLRERFSRASGSRASTAPERLRSFVPLDRAQKTQLREASVEAFGEGDRDDRKGQHHLTRRTGA